MGRGVLVGFHGRTRTGIAVLDGVSSAPSPERVLSSGEEGHRVRLGGRAGERAGVDPATLPEGAAHVGPAGARATSRDGVAAGVPASAPHRFGAQNVLVVTARREYAMVPLSERAGLMIRLLIPAGIRLYQEGLAQILAREARLPDAGTAADAPTAIHLAGERPVDVALVDMAMPHSIAAMRGIAAREPGIKVVALGLRESEHDLVICAEAGIAGYVARAASIADLVAVLESVGRGELLCSPRTAATLLPRLPPLPARHPTPAPPHP